MSAYAILAMDAYVGFSNEAKKVRIESRSGFPTFYQITMAGFDKTLPQKEIKDGI